MQKVLEDVTKDEFIAIMEILKCQKSMTTVQGRQQLVDIVTEQAELDEPFVASDPDCVDRLTQCIKHAAPLFSKNVHSKASWAIFVIMSCHILISWPVLKMELMVNWSC